MKPDFGKCWAGLGWASNTPTHNLRASWSGRVISRFGCQRRLDRKCFGTMIRNWWVGAMPEMGWETRERHSVSVAEVVLGLAGRAGPGWARLDWAGLGGLNSVERTAARARSHTADIDLLHAHTCHKGVAMLLVAVADGVVSHGYEGRG